MATALFDESDSELQTLPVPVDNGGTWSPTESSGYPENDKLMAPVDLMILLLKLKHNLTKEATEDIAKLLNVVNGRTVAASSVYKLEKDFISGKNDVQVHHVCNKCGSYVGVVATYEVCCPLPICSFKMNVQDSLKGGHFFFYLPLRQQLVDLFHNHDIYRLLHATNSLRTEDSITDIYDGFLYKRLCVSTSDTHSHISLTFNCDGVPVFKSSKFSIWPILCVVNELPPDIRAKHILLTALWFGSGKPDMNAFLAPFVKECQQLDRNGFSFTCQLTNVRIRCKAHAIVGVCDSVARPLMQNFKQYNGTNGCGFCLDDGALVEKGLGWTRVYPYNPDMMLRTNDNTEAFVLEAGDTTKPCFGVKGPSLLSRIPNFDIIRGMVPDYMHCMCLGVVRQMATLWLDTKYHNQRYYLGSFVRDMNIRLLSIKPPCSVSRTPRSLCDMKYWKAHEWLVWLLFYSLPVMRGFLCEPYYAHWSVLVKCVSILIGVNISDAQLNQCESALMTFVIDFSKLYGEEHVSFNVHQTLHIVDSVRDCGPLWTHSAFMFESFNGALLKMIRGTQGVPIQILNKFYLTRAIPANVKAVLPKCTDTEKCFIQSLTAHKQHVKSALRLNGITLLGRPKIRNLVRAHYVALHSASAVVNQTCVAYYDRIIINGDIVHSANYCKDLKRNSFTVQIANHHHSYFQIGTFLTANLGNGEQCYAIGRYLTEVPFTLCKLKLDHIIAVSKMPSPLIAVLAEDIERKCIFISLRDHHVDFVCKQVHLLECCS